MFALHPDVQQRVREEAIQAQKEAGGELDYDTLINLPYLDAVLRETLRCYPPIIALLREYVPYYSPLSSETENKTCRATEDAILPLRYPVKSADGTETFNELPLKKGTGILTNILGVNRNKVIWGEDAEEWKPERWLKPLPQSVADAKIPGVFSQM